MPIQTARVINANYLWGLPDESSRTGVKPPAATDRLADARRDIIAQVKLRHWHYYVPSIAFQCANGVTAAGAFARKRV
jgi:hypothetical protein